MINLKIIQIISSAGFYGAERVLLELALYFREQGHDSRIGAFVHPGQKSVQLLEEAQKHKIPTVEFACQGKLDALAARRINDYVTTEQIDVVHSHGYKADIYLFLSQLPSSILRLATCHNWLSENLMLLGYEFIDKLMLHHFDQVIGVSPLLMKELATAGIPSEKCSLIPNGLNLENAVEDAARTKIRREFSIGTEEIVGITIGRFDLYKNHLGLLEAFAIVQRTHQAKLIIVGDGDLRPQIEKRIKELGLSECVVLAGYRRDIAALLTASDLFILSSIKEGLPMVLLEAMAAKLPIVSTSVGAISEVIENGQEGLLVEPLSPLAMSAAISSLFMHPQLRQQMGQRGHEKFIREYSRQAMGSKYLALYQRLLREKSV